MTQPDFVPLSPMATLRWEIVRSELDRIRPAAVLELGCGQGGYGARIAARVERYLGVEPDAQSSSLARTRIVPFGGSVLTGMSDDIPAGPAFDAICAFEVLEHLEDDVAALRDWTQKLKPGGWVVVSVPAWPERFSPMDELVGHFRRYEPAGLAAVLGEAGCTDVRVLLYGWPLGFVLEAVRNRIAARRSTGAAGGHSDSMDDRSAASGRLFQPRAMAATAVRFGVAPFAKLQRVRPGSGTGLVGIGRIQSAG